MKKFLNTIKRRGFRIIMHLLFCGFLFLMFDSVVATPAPIPTSDCWVEVLTPAIFGFGVGVAK
jgi:hypothetical protein